MPDANPMLDGAFEIAGYISPNISPEVLIACGPDDEIAEFADRIAQAEWATIVARATDGKTAFLKVHLGAMFYGDFIELMRARPPQVEMPFVRRAIPSTENGRVEDVGNPYASPVIVGILADANTLGQVSAHLSWAKCQAVDLGLAGRGIAFEPSDADFDAYQAFVRDAAAGRYANADVVMLRRPRVQEGR